MTSAIALGSAIANSYHGRCPQRTGVGHSGDLCLAGLRRVYSFFVTAAAKASTLSDYIESTPGVCGGKPCIRGTRVKVSSIVARHVFDGQSLDEIVDALGPLTLAQLHAALVYYYDHRDEVEQEVRDEDDLVERLARRYAPHLVAE